MAKNDGKVTFELDVDDSQVKSKISKSIDEINRTAAGKKTTINVDANTAAATTQLHKVKAAADAVETADPTVTVDADTGAATTQLHGVKADADAVEASDPTVTVDADTSAATSGLEDVRARAEDAGTAVDALGNAIERAAGKTSALKTGFAQGIGQWAAGGAASVGRAAVGAIGDIFSGGMDYETGTAKASTLAPQGADMDAFGSALLALSIETGQDVGTLTEAAYNMLSAGVDFGGSAGAGLIDYLRKSARLGIGGYTDANTAGLSVAKTLNAYGMDEDQMDRVANVMLKTQNKGITDVGKLSQSMSNVTSIAAAGGVSIEQVGAMLATITAQGVETAEATTQSRSLIAELMKDNTTANKNMTAALKGTKYAGMSLSEIMAAGGNIVDILGAMESYATQNGISMMNLFSSEEASQAMLKLLNLDGQMFRDNLDYMLDGTDAVTDAYTTMAETNGMTLKKIGAQFEAFKLQLYTALGPALEKLLGIFEGEGFKVATIMLINRLTNLLSGDALNRVVDGLVSAANFLLDILSGKVSLGDVIRSGLESAWGWLSEKLQGIGHMIGNWFVDGINQVIDGLNSISIFGQKPFSISRIKRFGESDPEPDDKPKPSPSPDPSPGRMTPEMLAAQAVLDRYGIENAANMETALNGLAAFEGLQAELIAAVETLRAGGVNPVGDWTQSKPSEPESISVQTLTVTSAQFGDKGENVSALQYALQKLGFNPGAVDGIFGRNTQGAVKEFQSSHGLEATGNLDAKTVEAMNAALEDAAGQADTMAEGSASAAAAITGQAEASEATKTAAVGAWASMALVNSAASGLKTSMLSAKTAASGLQGAIAGLISRIRGTSVSAGGGGAGTTRVSKYAVGLDVVPYDDYPALLHKGEMVLNAAEASAYRMGGGRGADGFAIDYEQLARAMANVSLEMDGQKVGRLVEKSVSAAQSARYNRATRKG